MKNDEDQELKNIIKQKHLIKAPEDANQKSLLAFRKGLEAKTMKKSSKLKINRQLFASIVTSAAVIGIMIVLLLDTDLFANNELGSTPSQPAADVGEDVEEKAEQNDQPNQEPALTVGGNDNPEQYPSNSKLHLAHLSIAVITYNTTFNNDGRPLNQEDFEDLLNRVKENLDGIIYDGDKEDELQKAIDLTDQAIEQNTGKGDPILDDIHQIVHGLLEYFNGKAEDIKVDETGAPINKDNSIAIPDGWKQERFDETKYNFGNMATIEDVKREIVQMTTQKIESKQVKELLGGDAPEFLFTPAYPSGLGEFVFTSDYAVLSEDNLVYLKKYIEGMELDGETLEYFQEFLTEWKTGDFSNLIDVHKTFLLDVSIPSENLQGYLEVDDYRLATEEKKAFLEHYGLGG